MAVTSAVRKPYTSVRTWLTPRRQTEVSVRPTLFPPLDEEPQRRASDGDLDWRRAAPRWLLLAVLAALLVVLGGTLAEWRGLSSRESQRIEAALADAPSKYQARLSERIAVVEAQTQNLTVSISQLAAQIDQQNRSTAALTTELRVLNAEMKRSR